MKKHTPQTASIGAGSALVSGISTPPGSQYQGSPASILDWPSPQAAPVLPPNISPEIAAAAQRAGTLARANVGNAMRRFGLF